MPKVVIHLFHGDDDSLATGSHVAERIRQIAPDQKVGLEVFCFGPAQDALVEPSTTQIRTEYNQQIDELIEAGVPVGACLNAARAAGMEHALSQRGVRLQFARDAFVRFALEGATVMNF
ncbi:MAG: hypothetical protein ACP5O6_00460 [Candidatus Baltobacteraceae bacterium]